MSEHTREPWRVEDNECLIWGNCNPDDQSSWGMGKPIMKDERPMYSGAHQQMTWEEARANSERTCAAVNFTAGFPTEALNGSSLGEVCDALRAAEAVMGRNIYPQPDKDSPDWKALCDLRALLARLQPTDTGDSHD